MAVAVWDHCKNRKQGRILFLNKNGRRYKHPVLRFIYLVIIYYISPVALILCQIFTPVKNILCLFHLKCFS